MSSQNLEWLTNVLGEGNGTPLQYCCPENPMDGGAWAAVHGVAKSQTRLSDFTFAFHFHALEKERATHSSVLAWRIPGTGEPGGLPSMGSHRVGHDWSDLAATDVLNIPWNDFVQSSFASALWSHQALDNSPHSSKFSLFELNILQKLLPHLYHCGVGTRPWKKFKSYGHS